MKKQGNLSLKKITVARITDLKQLDSIKGGNTIDKSKIITPDQNE